MNQNIISKDDLRKMQLIELKVLKEEIKEDITHILYDATGHTPIVIPVIIVTIFVVGIVTFDFSR